MLCFSSLSASVSLWKSPLLNTTSPPPPPRPPPPSPPLLYSQGLCYQLPAGLCLCSSDASLSFNSIQSIVGLLFIDKVWHGDRCYCRLVNGHSTKNLWPCRKFSITLLSTLFLSPQHNLPVFIQLSFLYCAVSVCAPVLKAQLLVCLFLASWNIIIAVNFPFISHKVCLSVWSNTSLKLDDA